ncbi:MAG: hypothetical protein ACLR6B_09775 [Blautia sp.]
MKGKKKGVLLLLMLLSVFMLLPMGVSAAKLNMAHTAEVFCKRLQGHCLEQIQHQPCLCLPAGKL